jgi:hypothetical protein
MTNFEIKYKIFSNASDYTRELIRADFSVREAIGMSADLFSKSGDWDLDDLVCELQCMGFAEVDSYND